MTSKEFVIWLKGFTEGVHEFAITPKQWDYLKEKLSEVDDNTIPMGGILHDHNTFRTPYTTGTDAPPMKITTTPGVGSITIANPPFGFGVTSTATSLPSGSTISYTNKEEKIF